jgi:hypothetical protein
MSNYAWVCFNCRVTVRRHGTAKDVRCSSCAQPCNCLGWQTPIPPKSKIRDWELLKEEYFRLRRERALNSQMELVRRRHELEQEIRRLEAMPKNSGRTIAIKGLKKQLVEVSA